MILFIDDEKRRTDTYVQDLTRSGYEVVNHQSTDKAIEYFEQNSSEVELIILDIMMPSGNIFKDIDTDDGLRTGVHFYELVRDKAPKLPIIILTNVSDDEVRAKFQGEDKCWYFQKEHYLPHEITQEVKRVLG